ncbi:hypothetical protein Cgig2_024651 [Carnegiea gigantea]|uniref:RRM domain-containing protein n=1 Tax=Carnegiea gigantea TaxID=171969 RepID=A0A9Q1K8C9_9CARY|nr:hypothetical protein Cgig2_024651 [Carnegiea gigantea]
MGSLDPGAQEFRPACPTHHPPPPPLPIFYPAHPELIYPPFPPATAYVSPPPPPPPPPPSLPPPATGPTRAVLLSAVPPELSESVVRRELEVFGHVRAVQMERVREGIVTVHFYDLRAAHAAFSAVREQHMQHQNRLRLHFSTSFLAPNPPPPPPPAPGIVAGAAVWAQFTIPATNAFPDGHNQGTLIIFNLDPGVSHSTLKEIFQTFGAVKEVRETPLKRHQRFVEFYDVRDASKAMAEMNGKEINGRWIMIEFSRPGGHYCNKKHSGNTSNFNHYHNHPISLDLNLSPPPNFHHLMNTKPLPPPLPPQHRRTSPRNRPPSGGRRRRSPPSSEESIEAGISSLTLQERKNTHRRINPNVEEREKRKNNGGRSSSSNNHGNCSTANSQVNATKMESKSGKPWKVGKQKKNFDPRFMIKEEAIILMEGNHECRDSRTTVMIKNIPNKYSQKLLLNMLDNHCIHCNEQIATSSRHQPLSSYDFVYLPIDFNNKCNVGYGFVNMTSPEAALRLYKAFHHQHWEVFNSRKICEVTYARVQGLEALKEHFKNSKFACENDEYLPVVFSPARDGRRLTAPLPIVFSSTPSVTVPSHDEIDGGDFTSASTSPTTVPSSLDCCFDHEGDRCCIDDGEDHISGLKMGGESDGGEDRYQCQ